MPICTVQTDMIPAQETLSHINSYIDIGNRDMDSIEDSCIPKYGVETRHEKELGQVFQTLSWFYCIYQNLSQNQYNQLRYF